MYACQLPKCPFDIFFNPFTLNRLLCILDKHFGRYNELILLYILLSFSKEILYSEAGSLDTALCSI